MVSSLVASYGFMFYFTCFFYPRKVKNCQLRLYDRNNFMIGTVGESVLFSPLQAPSTTAEARVTYA